MAWPSSQIPFDEYQSRDNAKHTLRTLKEIARQGFCNGARPPVGYKIVGAEQRGALSDTKETYAFQR